MTSIIGDTITTGTIKSLDGLNFFNLTEGKFKVGDATTWMDWGVTSAGQLTINGALVTKMIFAEDAEIINLKVSSLRTAVNGKRIEILESENSLKFYDADDNLVLQIDDDIDSTETGTPLAGIRANNPDNSKTSYLSGNGVFSNGSAMRFLSVVTGINTNASLVGLLQSRNSNSNGISAGVVGIDQTTTGASKSFGGYFNSLFAGGLHVGVKSTTENYTCTDKDTFISCYNTSPINIELPPNPKIGKTIIVRRNNNDVTIQGNGKSLVVTGVVSSKGMGASNGQGDCAICFFDGSYWTFNRLKV
jgi:hypothetical protein